MIPSNSRRVSRNTSPADQARIDAAMAARVRWFAEYPQHIESRLIELDHEWDVERVLEATAATLSFAGVMMGAGGDRRWLALPALVSGFLFQHAVKGWCPPLPVLRRLGVRTAREIETERIALKALRGDFGPIGPDARDHDTRASHAIMAARL